MKVIKYYYSPTRLQRILGRFKHPIFAFKAIRKYGLKTILIDCTWHDYLLPPDIKAWAVARGFPRKHDKDATEIIKV